MLPGHRFEHFKPRADFEGMIPQTNKNDFFCDRTREKKNEKESTKNAWPRRQLFERVLILEQVCRYQKASVKDAFITGLLFLLIVTLKFSNSPSRLSRNSVRVVYLTFKLLLSVCLAAAFCISSPVRSHTVRDRRICMTVSIRLTIAY